MLWKRIKDFNPMDYSRIVIMTTTLKIYTVTAAIESGFDGDRKFSNLIFRMDDDYMFLNDGWLSDKDAVYISASSVLYWADIADVFANLMNTTNVSGVPVQSKFVADLMDEIQSLREQKDSKFWKYNKKSIANNENRNQDPS